MREHGRVVSNIWASEDFGGLSEAGKLMVLYQLTCSHGNMVGIYRLTPGTASDDLGWGTDRVSEGFKELAVRGFSTHCPRTKWLVIHRYLYWNPVRGPKQREGLVKVVRTMPRGSAISGEVWRVISQYVQELEGAQLAAIREHLDAKNDVQTMPLPLGMPNRIVRVPIEVEVEVEVEVEEKGDGRKAGEGASRAPPPVDDAEKPAARAADAYGEAFKGRYQVPPVFNAKVRGQFAQLVKRLGETAPAVAAFYVRHQRKVYIDAMHCVDLLVRDAEQLHAEFQRAARSGVNGDWWKNTHGVRKMAERLGVAWQEGEDTNATFTARVIIAAGEGPWREKMDALVESHVQRLLEKKEAA